MSRKILNTDVTREDVEAVLRQTHGNRGRGDIVRVIWEGAPVQGEILYGRVIFKCTSCRPEETNFHIEMWKKRIYVYYLRSTHRVWSKKERRHGRKIDCQPASPAVSNPPGS